MAGDRGLLPLLICHAPSPGADPLPGISTLRLPSFMGRKLFHVLVIETLLSKGVMFALP